MKKELENAEYYVKNDSITYNNLQTEGEEV
jgi:hypothetical protein